jgi:hypothetical protein
MVTNLASLGHCDSVNPPIPALALQMLGRGAHRWVAVWPRLRGYRQSNSHLLIPQRLFERPKVRQTRPNSLIVSEWFDTFVRLDLLNLLIDLLALNQRLPTLVVHSCARNARGASNDTAKRGNGQQRSRVAAADSRKCV